MINQETFATLPTSMLEMLRMLVSSRHYYLLKKESSCSEGTKTHTKSCWEMYLAFLHWRSDGLDCSIDGGTSIPSTLALMGWKDASSGILPEKALHSLNQELLESENRRRQIPRSKEVQEILKALPTTRFIAVPTSAEPTLAVIGNEAHSSEDTLLESSQGVEVPRLVPEEAMEPDGQPDEEEEIAVAPQDLNNAVKAKAWDALGMLFYGDIWVNENTAGKLCILHTVWKSRSCVRRLPC